MSVTCMWMERLIGNSVQTESWSSTIPRTSRLIALELTNNVGVGSVLISMSNKFQTNEVLLSRWKCSEDDESERWTEIEFEDKDWADAVVTGKDDQDFLEDIQGNFGHDAVINDSLPIWITHDGDQSLVRFRGHIGESWNVVECISSTLKNAGDYVDTLSLSPLLSLKRFWAICPHLSECGCENKCDVQGNDFTCSCIIGLQTGGWRTDMSRYIWF